MNKSVPKPPVGITPRYEWENQRIITIYNAIGRYIEAGIEVPREWFDELEELLYKTKNNTIIDSHEESIKNGWIYG